MRCFIIGHENFDPCGVCMDNDCDKESRLICPKCLIGYHQTHLNSIILFNDIIDLKQKDLDHLKIFPEVEEIKYYVEEGARNKLSFTEISTEIEKSSSLMYDLILNNFDTLNHKIKSKVESNLKLDYDHLSEILNSFEESTLLDNTSLLINKQITGKHYEDTITNTLIRKLKEIKLTVNNQKKDEKKNIPLKERKISDAEEHEQKINKLSKKIACFYNELKMDLVNLFKQHLKKVENLNEAFGSLFKFIPTTYTGNKDVKIEEIYDCAASKYTIKGRNLCLIGDKIFSGPVNKWKLVFDSAHSFSCCGFGLGSLDDPQLLCNSLSSNNANVLMCLCCNGPWSAKGMKIINTYSKIGARLLMEEKKEIIFEVNKLEDKFRIIDNNNSLHSEIPISSLKFKENLVPILNCTTGVNISFKIVDLNV